MREEIAKEFWPWWQAPWLLAAKAHLYAKYDITKPEQRFIESMIKPME